MTVDKEALDALVRNAVWEPRPDWGAGVSFAYHGVGGPVAAALDWECGSCRPDVGWADWTRAVKAGDGTITFFVECGHCGATYNYDVEGNELEDV